MRHTALISVTLVTALTACSGATSTMPAGPAASQPAAAPAQHPLHPSAAQLGLWPKAGPAVRVCGAVADGYARCQAWMRTDVHGLVRPDTPSGYSPVNLQTAYNLTSASGSDGSGVTVAIVDAYDDPNAASDVAVYRKQFGISACGSGCFTKYKMGSAANSGWAEEESLDVTWFRRSVRTARFCSSRRHRRR